MAEQLNTAGATQLAEPPAQPAPTASTTATSTTSNSMSHDSVRASAESPSTPVTGTKSIPFAAVSFVCGLVGLLVANLVLGPLAIVLGVMGLRADKSRRVRAVLGILLGVADIALFVFLAVHSGAHHGSVSWNFFSN